jgi:hypothetical protein
MRRKIGDIIAAPGGTKLVLKSFDKCRTTAGSAGYEPTKAFRDHSRALLTYRHSTLSGSMLRDIQAGGPIEADHIIGDLLARRESLMLSISYTGLKAYEIIRNRVLSLQTGMQPSRARAATCPPQVWISRATPELNGCYCDRFDARPHYGCIGPRSGAQAKWSHHHSLQHCASCWHQRLPPNLRPGLRNPPDRPN